MKMKLSTKPISSPARADKYPPPLMRFLRSNVGSRSRGRSRSSPMFVRKKNTAIDTQEPTSPKVTCMGQVRVRRSKQAKTPPGKPQRRCKWIQNAVFCHHFGNKFKVNSFRPAWRKRVFFFRVGFRRKGRDENGSSKIEPKSASKSEDYEHESEGEEERADEGEPYVYVSEAISPPKNALLLTRCRSAPYRSSSLACRFWGSPVSSEETEQQQSTTERENRANYSPTSKGESGSISRDSDQESSLDAESQKKAVFFKEISGSVTPILERSVKPEKSKGLEIKEDDQTVRPSILTRCKSEPARTGEKLDPEMGFWKKRRLGLM